MSRAVLAAAFALSSFTMPNLLVASTAVAATCGDDVPVEWKRPGGYCDQLEGKDSLTEAVEGYKDPCGVSFFHELLRNLPLGEEVLVAGC